MSEKLLDWNEVLIGAAIKDPGNSKSYETGSWRVERPVWNPDTCINCMFCWVYCPDSSILVDENGKMAGIDYDHCKGCGICVEQCPTKPKSLAMLLESETKGKSEEEIRKEAFSK
jgi:pyruvate ferredoxin oxidoreductase delta subunit